MMNGINVLSLFDGIGAAKIALDQLGIKVDAYFSSEIDQFANKVLKDNYPDLIHVGDVCSLSGGDFFKGGQSGIDLLIGGSPCQGFSRAGQKLLFKDDRSKLVFEFIRLKNELKPKWFLLENVVMKKECQDEISRQLGFEPIIINSSLFSAQNRVRSYWTNIPVGELPEDYGVTLSDVLDDDFDESFILSRKELDYMNRKTSRNRTHWDFYAHFESDQLKSPCLTANLSNGVPYNVLIQKPRGKNAGGIKAVDGKTPTLTSSYWQENNLLFSGDLSNHIIRKLAPEECEKLQCIPAGHTKCVSKTQRYRLVGNSFNVETVKWILKGIKR